MENESQPQAQEKKKRVRLLSPKKQLQVTLLRMEKLAQSNTLKETKLADLLLAMGDLQKMLLKLTTDEETEKLETEHAELSAQHTASAQRIAELEAENARLRHQEVRTVTLPDPEATTLREQNAGLREIVTALTKSLDIDARARLAVHVMHTQPDRVARALLPMLGMNYATYWQMMHRNQTEQELLAQVENSTEWNWNGNLNVFARAALAVIHGVAVSSRKPKKREFDPTIFGRIEDQQAELRAQREALEAQRTSPANIDSGEF